jgi:hypothetical protein
MSSAKKATVRRVVMRIDFDERPNGRERSKRSRRSNMMT